MLQLTIFIVGIRDVFPTATNLLCHWHVSKNVKAKIKELVGDKQRQIDLNTLWLQIVSSNDEPEYDLNVKMFEASCLDVPDLMKYVRETWLTNHKERFVDAWTNLLPHLGNGTTNRAESAHSMLKRHLKTSQGDFSRCFVKFDELLRLNFNKIIISWQDSINKIQVKSNNFVFKNLRGRITHSALNLMVDELERSKAGVRHEKKLCGCTQKKVFKLPCACELGVFHMCGTSINLGDIDQHWKHLSLDVFEDKKSTQGSFPGCSISLEIKGIVDRFNKMSEDEQFVFKKLLGELAWTSTTSLVAPTHKAKTKGAPKKKKEKFFDAKRDPSQWEHVDKKMKMTLTSETATGSKKASQPASHKMTQGTFRKISQSLETQGHLHFIRPHMHSFVERITNVGDDGNCGFRAVAVGLDWDEESWSLVRQDLIKESREREELYTQIYGKDQLLEIRNAFTPEGHGAQLMDKWLSMPEMGCFIATKYNVALVQLSLDMNVTYLPLRGSYARSKRKLVCILNVGNKHWMNVTLSPTSALPPVDPIWWARHSEEAGSWIDALIGRVNQWQALDPSPPLPPPTSYDAPIDLAADTDDI